jgi:hypothetical protein
VTGDTHRIGDSPATTAVDALPWIVRDLGICFGVIPITERALALDNIDGWSRVSDGVFPACNASGLLFVSAL